MIRLAARIKNVNRIRNERDSGSAMLMSVMFTVFAGGIMLVLLSVLLSQSQSAQLAQKNTRTGYAAQAGIQSALSVLRSNTKTAIVNSATQTYGDPTKLPDTLTGNVDGNGNDALSYTVHLQYFLTDPTGKSDSWLNANALPHPLSDDPALQPTFVRLVSEGEDAAVGDLADATGDRTITALYGFTTTNVNIPGGTIRSKNGASCLRADSAVAGSGIKMVPIAGCTDEQRDMWVYDTDYRLKLASSLGSAEVLCITGQAWVSTPTGTNNSAANATLQPCADDNDRAHGNQLWSWDDPGSWAGQNRQNTDRTPRWLGVSGTTVIESRTRAGVFDPSPSVGAGAASITTSQIVNFHEFGRCMDVANNVISTAYMIVYPCKQDPTGTGDAVNWNHKWYYAEPAAPAATTGAQALWVKQNETTPYCLTARAGTPNTDVHFTTCSQPENASSLSTQQKFIRNSDTGSALTSYTFQFAADTSLCLTAVPEPGQNWSHIRLLTCNGSSAQKWNAPAITSGSTLGGYKEIG